MMIVKPIFGSSDHLPDLKTMDCHSKQSFFWRVVSDHYGRGLYGLTNKIIKVPAANDLVQLFFKVIRISHAQRRQRELREIFNALLEQHEIDQALKLTEFVVNPLERSFLLKRISEVLLQQKKIEEAFRVAESIPDPLQKSLTIHHICFVLSMEGHTELAFEMAKAMPDLLMQSYTIRIISEVLLEEGKPDEALHLIYFMQEGQEKDYALENVIQFLIKIGCIDETFDHVEKIQDDFIRSKAMMIILRAFLKLGKVHESMKLTEKMPHVLVQQEALQRIQNYLLQRGEMKEASKLITKIFLCKKKFPSLPLPHFPPLPFPSAPPNPFSLNESPLIDSVKVLEDFLLQMIEKLSIDTFSERYLKQRNRFEAICSNMYSIAELDNEPLQKIEYGDLEDEIQEQLKTMAPATLEKLREGFAQSPEICLRFLDPAILILKINRLAYSNQLLPPIERLLPGILSYDSQQLAFLCEKLIEEKILILALPIALKISDPDLQSHLLQTISSPFRWKKNPSQAIKIAELIPNISIQKLALSTIGSYIAAKD